MEPQAQVVDPWQMTIGLLGQLSGEKCPGSPVPAAPEQASRRSADKPVPGLTIRVLERATATRVTLAWRDPSRCAYCDQEWYRTRARRAGVCVVSGRKMRRGEDVYRPRTTRPQALNADAMIHSVVLDEAGRP
ncbi:DUF3331 domain-containing protein [Paraburkholderia sp. MMS20-SJTR3]|uniref:DUF3331 domain-containing protein n=1 Tax=Paraburkholderia sejongensis TaxID=2886946 RepID=A0ABS8JSS2_9BURK|nr:DUF3331 domain-containing protein [Paraburkholderia sp. MMS20-SJTR3]MCC8392914.1 DUF3331 domain-containing protein [Paraburkholderia sp. MMS20-SJTR3]